jgi:tRNA A58 N-methylase Trm61
MDTDQERAGLAWQLGVWNRIAAIYLREIDRRFAPVVQQVIGRATLTAGQHVLDLGTGTGAVAERAAQLVGPRGRAGVTTAHLPSERQQEAQAAVMARRALPGTHTQR